ncbi:MAG: hypothetical protein RL375_1506 [Pseudomonadota bacterium]
MNCPYAPIDAGYVSLSRVHASHGMFMQQAFGRVLGSDIVAALHPHPGEGPGES